MKTTVLFSLLGTAALLAGPPEKAPGPQPEPPPPVVPAPPPAPRSPAEARPYEQRNWGYREPLVQPEQARAIVDKFKAAYPDLGDPRLLIYVNRELVDETSGLKLQARTEKTVASRSKADLEPVAGATATNAVKGTRQEERVENENRYRLNEKSRPALADKQTTREIEQVFGRPFRAAGARLVDQRAATQLLPDKPLDQFSVVTEGEQARKDREVLAKLADVAIEILVSARDVTVAGISGNQTYSVPDILVTAISLKDAQILGQASSADVIGKNPAPSVVRNYDARQISEATALALMEDMLRGKE